MPTIETSIWLALRARVESLVLSPVHPIAWPNEAFEQPQTGSPPMAAPYLEVMLFRNTTDRITIGSAGPHRHKGFLQVAVMSPLNQNAAVSTETAGLIAAHFTADLKLRRDGRTVRITKTPDIMRGLRDDRTQRWMTPVSIPCECFA